jgi:hypothetical protein
MFLELRDYYVNAVRLHVIAADALVRRGVDKTTSDNRRYERATVAYCQDADCADLDFLSANCADDRPRSAYLGPVLIRC